MRGLEIVEATLRDDEGETFVAKWIGRRRFVYGRFHAGMRLFVRGRTERSLAGPVVNVGQYAQLAEGETYRGELVPVYRASKDLASRKIAAVVKKNLSRLLETVPAMRSRSAWPRPRGYPSLRDAYRAAHAPADHRKKRDRARERFIFGEFLALATAAQLRRVQREHDQRRARACTCRRACSTSSRRRCRSR